LAKPPGSTVASVLWNSSLRMPGTLGHRAA
jgi:hypothetical protein